MLSIEEYVNTPIEIERELKFLFKRNSPEIILDIGSCTGEDSIKYSNLFPHAKIIAFEPLGSNIKIMRDHFQKFNKNNIIIENIALSDEEGEADFYLSSGSPIDTISEDSYTTLIPKEWNKSSSLLMPSEESSKHMPWLKFEKKEKVRTIRLDSYLQKEEINFVDFAHLDVQGAELKVLQGMGSFINKLKVLWIEVENIELYKGQPLKNDLHRFLKHNNFQLIKDTSIQKIAGDCLYINKNFFNVVNRFLVKKLSLFREI
ncbi:MAG: FkbM family methyltransferase [Sediminibacterium sp.]